jgi:hypothetical protein
LGLIQAERAKGETEYLSPLLRANIGLPDKFEILFEFGYLPDENEFADGAVGFKWIPSYGKFSAGMEILALLPIRPGDDGLGIQPQFLATWRNPKTRVHVNAGGFYDSRTSETKKGWRASILTEVTGDQFRPGIEIFAKQKNGEDVDIRLGAGFIKIIGRFDIRSGIHLGLTNEAPDIVFNFWISKVIPF